MTLIFIKTTYITWLLFMFSLYHHLSRLVCDVTWYVGWLVGCFGFNSSLRQYFSQYRAVSQREGERGKNGWMRIKMSKQTPTRTYCKHSRPLSYCYPNRRTPRHWKFTQHHRTTRPPPTWYVICIMRLWLIVRIFRAKFLIKINAPNDLLSKRHGIFDPVLIMH